MFLEHGTFIGTDKQVIINEPTGDVAKYANGDTAIISSDLNIILFTII
jgi:hypothetical protein